MWGFLTFLIPQSLQHGDHGLVGPLFFSKWSLTGFPPSANRSQALNPCGGGGGLGFKPFNLENNCCSVFHGCDHKVFWSDILKYLNCHDSHKMKNTKLVLFLFNIYYSVKYLVSVHCLLCAVGIAPDLLQIIHSSLYSFQQPVFPFLLCISFHLLLSTHLSLSLLNLLCLLSVHSSIHPSLPLFLPTFIILFSFHVPIHPCMPPSAARGWITVDVLSLTRWEISVALVKGSTLIHNKNTPYLSLSPTHTHMFI